MVVVLDQLTVGGHSAVETFLEATRLAAIATVASDGTVVGVLTRVRTATKTLLVLHCTPEETLNTRPSHQHFLRLLRPLAINNSCQRSITFFQVNLD